MLHIHNGDSTAGTARQANIPGEHIAWPGFDVLADGRFITAPIDIRETALWAIDLTYKEQ